MSEIDVLTPKQVARLMGVHYQTVLKWIDSGQLRARKLGERFFIRREWINEMLDSSEEQQSA